MLSFYFLVENDLNFSKEANKPEKFWRHVNIIIKFNSQGCFTCDITEPLKHVFLLDVVTVKLRNRCLQPRLYEALCTMFITFDIDKTKVVCDGVLIQRIVYKPHCKETTILYCLVKYSNALKINVNCQPLGIQRMSMSKYSLEREISCFLSNISSWIKFRQTTTKYSIKYIKAGWHIIQSSLRNFLYHILSHMFSISFP